MRSRPARYTKRQGVAKREAISSASVLASGPISGGPSKPRSRAASRVRSPTRSKGKRRRASGRGQSGPADNNSKARALVAMTPSITPAGHIAPVGTISRTGDSTASCPSHASCAAVRFDSSRARVSKTSMSLAIYDKQLHLALERVPIKWNHLIDKDAAQNQRIGACPHETSDISDV